MRLKGYSTYCFLLLFLLLFNLPSKFYLIVSHLRNTQITSFFKIVFLLSVHCPSLGIQNPDGTSKNVAWISKNFGRSQNLGSRWVSKSRFRVIFWPLSLEFLCQRVQESRICRVFFFFFGLLESKFSEFMYATAYQTEPVNKIHKSVNKTKEYIGGLSLASSYDFGHFVQLYQYHYLEIFDAWSLPLGFFQSRAWN